MTARFRETRVDLDPTEPVLRILARVENAGAETWTAAAGDCFSYQIFDAETELLLVDGPRLALDAPLEPHGQAPLELTARLPAEDGRYRVFVSPLREHVAWAFEQGSPFLLAEAEVRSGAGRLLRSEVTGIGRLRLRRWARTAGRAFTYPWRSIWRNRSLIRSMVRRDIAGRYAGSHAGIFWTVIHPLMMMATYWFVFGYVLKTRFGADDRSSNFTLYFLAGMLPWLAFSEAAGRSASIVIEHASFVKRLIFPVEILPVNLVFAGLFTEAFGLGIFLVGMALFGWPIPATAALLPLLLIPQTLFTLGISWFLAALAVFVRDLGQIIGFALTVWFFITPICYPEPEHLPWLFEANPLYILVEGYRAVFLEARPPDWRPLAALTVASLAIFAGGYAWFHRLKKSFADLL